MRGPSASRASTAVAVVSAIVAILAVILPGVGLGQPTTSHGGSPSDVFMQTQAAPEACAEVPAGSLLAMPQELDLAVTSHVLAYFTFEWTGLDAKEFGALNLALDGVGIDQQYKFTGRESRINPNGTVMWSFPNVAPGTHTVAVFTAVDDLDLIDSDEDSRLAAGLQNCALTVFVIPVAE